LTKGKIIFAVAAIKIRRHYVGYDISKDYGKLTERCIKKFSLNFNVPR
jgi:hypothetical protein